MIDALEFPKSISVLIVDDEEKFCTNLQKSLERAGKHRNIKVSSKYCLNFDKAWLIVNSKSNEFNAVIVDKNLEQFENYRQCLSPIILLKAASLNRKVKCFFISSEASFAEGKNDPNPADFTVWLLKEYLQPGKNYWKLQKDSELVEEIVSELAKEG